MSNLIGAVSLSNNTGVFLGSVNLNNLNLDPNQIVYSSDGVNMSGLNIGDGLQKVNDELITTFNPAIGTSSNIIYINDGVSDIQTGINNATQGDVINVSSGSYGGATITINNKQNIAIICPYRGQGSTICELAGGRGLTIANTSSTITINSLQIEGLLTLGATGNNYFTNLQCLSGITVSAGATGNYFFYMSEIAGAITVPNTFAGVLFFSECNFAGASFSLNNVSPLQVQITQSLNLPTSRPVKATFSANNADTSQQITTNTKFLNDSNTNSGKYLSSDGVNGIVWSTLPSGSGLSATNQAVKRVPYCTSTNNVLNCEEMFSYDEALDKLSVPSIGATDIQTSTLSANTITASYLESVIEINNQPYPPPSSGVSVDPQNLECIPFCSAVNNELTTDQQFQFSPTAQTLFLLNNTASIYVNKIENLKNIIFENGTNTLNSNNQVLTTDGVQGFKLTPVGGEFSNYNVLYLDGQQTVKTGASINMITIPSTFGKLSNFGLMWNCIFNFSVSANSSILTITLTDKGITKTITQSTTSNGHHQISLNMWQNSNGQSDIDATITFAVSSGTISTDVNDYYSVQVYNIKNFASSIPV